MNQALKKYTPVVEFLGECLGHSYEVVLYDVANQDKSIVAIANSFVSGRTLLDPITDRSLKMLERIKETGDNFHANYNSYSRDGKRLRGSSYYIRDDFGEVIGILAIYFDDTKYVNLTHEILSLCHPDTLISQNSYEKIDDHYYDEETEHLERSITDIASSMVTNTIKKKEIPVDNMTKEDKFKIVEELNKKGIFLLKGSVSEVAKLINASDATIYRYLSDLEKKE